MLLNLLFAVHIVHCGVEIGNIPELRWYLFCKHRAESDRLPPILGSLKQHILRVHLQAQIWGQPKAATQSFLNPHQNRFYKDNNGLIKPKTTTMSPAPDATIEMVRCQCKTNCTTKRCSCLASDLACTDLCICGETMSHAKKLPF